MLCTDYDRYLNFFLKNLGFGNAVVNLNQGKLHDENYVQYLYCML